MQAKQQVQQFVEDVQCKWRYRLPPGRNPGIKFMAHLWEPLRVCPLPLALHCVSEALHLLCHGLLLGAGFSAFQSDVSPTVFVCNSWTYLNKQSAGASEVSCAYTHALSAGFA